MAMQAFEARAVCSEFFVNDPPKVISCDSALTSDTSTSRRCWTETPQHCFREGPLGVMWQQRRVLRFVTFVSPRWMIDMLHKTIVPPGCERACPASNRCDIYKACWLFDVQNPA
jgi:hypothetical protein